MDDLLAVMARLRGPGGCPWDAEQTLETLKPFLVEECYEVIDALDAGPADHHREELGDLLLQIVFQARIREERGEFRFQDVVDTIREKLVRRHPHVFGDVSVKGTSEVLRNWDAIKAAEKGGDRPRSAVDGVPRSLPALQRAQQVQARAARVGFDWAEMKDVVAKVEEEVAEVRKALEAKDDAKVSEEIGDLLFAAVNLSRFGKLQAEQVLHAAVAKFIRRFQAVEEAAREAGRKPQDMTPRELDALWEAVKGRERA